MCTVQKDACSCRVSTFSAHSQLVGRISGLIFVRGERRSLIGAAVSRSCVMDGTSMMPGVLFWVMHQWRHFCALQGTFGGWVACLHDGR